MTIPEAASFFKTTERTVSDWRKRGAPVDNVAALTSWLESNLRHTTLDTQAVIDRRRAIEMAGKQFIRSYIFLRKSLPGPAQSDWEIMIGTALDKIDSSMEDITLFLNPDVAVDPSEKSSCERLNAEVWPVSGNESPKPKGKTKSHA